MPSYDDISLGALLVEAGFLKREELERGVRLLEALEKRGDPRQLHTVLAAEGIVEVQILRRALAHLRRESLRCAQCGKEEDAANLSLTSTFLCKGCKTELPLPEVISASELEMVTVTLDEIQVSEEQESIVGKVVGGVEIQSKLGQGGMGAVYRGRQLSLNRPVALKILPPELTRNRQYVQRFNREAQAVAQLNHPNVVQVFETGKTEETHYIVMELVVGKSLGALLAEKGSLPITDALDIMAQSARALDAAGRRSIVHRDIKPDNILIDQDGKVKVADFGLAKNTETGGGFTKTGQVMGTPAYMAPEQCEGRTADGRTDIYALGATFYHCLAGAPPFAGATPIAVLNKHVHEPLTPLRQVKPDLPEEICGVVEKMLAKDPDDRYAKAGDLVEDLECLRAGTTQMLSTRVGSAIRAVRAESAPGRGLRLLVGFIIVAALGVGGFFLYQEITGSEEGPPPVETGPPGPTGPTGKAPPIPDPDPVPPPPGTLPAGTHRIVAPRDGLVMRDFSVEVRGEVAPDVEKVEVLGSTVPILQGSFSRKVALNKGENRIVVTSVDGSGKRLESLITVMVDLDPPSLDIQNPPDGFATPQETIQVAGRVEDPHLSEVTINGGVVALQDGLFRGEVSLQEGMNRITIQTSDKAGNVETQRISVIRDGAGPVIRFLEPAGGSLTGSGELELTIELVEEYPREVTALGAKLRPLGDGRWTGTLSLQEGENEVIVAAIDQAGNQTEGKESFVLDSTLPTLSLTSPAEAEVRTGEGTLQVTGTVEDAHPGEVPIRVEHARGRGGPTPLEVNLDRTSATLSSFQAEVDLGEGENRISVVAVDEVGNQVSREVRVLLDSTPPEISLDRVPSMPPGGRGKVRIHGRVSEPVQAVEVNGVAARLDGEEFDSVVVVQGNVSQIEIEAWDLMGNVGTRSLELSTSVPEGLAAGERKGEFENIKDGAPLVLIPAGPFRMGSNDGVEFAGEKMADEAPVHEVTLPAYLIDRHEVTNRQYREFLDWMNRTGDHSRCHWGEPESKDHTPAYWDRDGWNQRARPVVGVDWYDAYAYAAWAEKRLPTEAEWEKAARGDDGRRFPWGNQWDRERCNSAARWSGEDLPTRQIWQEKFQALEMWSERALTLPVETLPDGASPFGCHDMLGNVAEWTFDWYDPEYYAGSPPESPGGPESGAKRVARGGAWGFREAMIRCADRGSLKPETRKLSVGFRCARDLKKSP